MFEHFIATSDTFRYCSQQIAHQCLARRKGRDLSDPHSVFAENKIDTDQVITGFHKYLKREGNKVTSANFMQNLSEKMDDPNFLGDIEAIIRPEVKYDSRKAYELVKAEIIEKI